jgi:hypothetical protein
MKLPRPARRLREPSLSPHVAEAPRRSSLTIDQDGTIPQSGPILA